LKREAEGYHGGLTNILSSEEKKAVSKERRA
jgi:hypothetical protein